MTTERKEELLKFILNTPKEELEIFFDSGVFNGYVSAYVFIVMEELGYSAEEVKKAYQTANDILDRHRTEFYLTL